MADKTELSLTMTNSGDNIKGETGQGVPDLPPQTKYIPQFSIKAQKCFSSVEIGQFLAAYHSGCLARSDQDAKIQHVSSIQYNTEVLDGNCKLIRMFQDWQVTRILRLMHLRGFQPKGWPQTIKNGWWTYCLDVWLGRVKVPQKKDDEDCTCRDCKCGRAQPLMPYPEDWHTSIAVAMFKNELYKEL